MEAKEQRQERRVGWKGTVDLVIAGREPISAGIADISEAGWGLDVAQAIETGTRFEIHGNGFEGEGIVRYCGPHEGGFRLGVKLVPLS
jgi:hypothetical protein